VNVFASRWIWGEVEGGTSVEGSRSNVNFSSQILFVARTSKSTTLTSGRFGLERLVEETFCSILARSD